MCSSHAQGFSMNGKFGRGLFGLQLEIGRLIETPSIIRGQIEPLIKDQYFMMENEASLITLSNPTKRPIKEMD
jgi:hypothetical protein